MKKLLILLMSSFFMNSNAQDYRSIQINSLVEIEKKFAGMASEKSINEAFLFFLADSSIIFRPGPVNGKTFIAALPSDKNLMSWEPSIADISISLDWGYTTGPYVLESEKNAKKSYGYYLSVWEKQKTGEWKVIIDLGSTAPSAHARKPKVFLEPQGFLPRNKVDQQLEIQNLLNLDKSFFNASAGISTYLTAFQDGSRFFRPHEHVYGKSEEHLEYELKNLVSWQPLGGSIAKSGDLGASYGSYRIKEGNGVMEGHYLRIWKKNDMGKWQVMMDMWGEN